MFVLLKSRAQTQYLPHSSPFLNNPPILRRATDNQLQPQEYPGQIRSPCSTLPRDMAKPLSPCRSSVLSAGNAGAQSRKCATNAGMHGNRRRWLVRLYARCLDLMFQQPIQSAHMGARADDVAFDSTSVVPGDLPYESCHSRSDTDATKVAPPVSSTYHTDVCYQPNDGQHSDELATTRLGGDSESGLPRRNARGLSLPVFLTIMGAIITFNIVVLSLNLAVHGPDPAVHTVLRILARVFSAVGLVYALAVSLFVALVASTSEEPAFRVKYWRCVQVLIPSIMCNVVGLAYVIVEA